MTGDERHNAFVAGYELGLAMRCDTDRREADHEARHAAVRPIVRAMVADIQRIKETDLQVRAELRWARQIEACEQYKADSIAYEPWPDEVAS